MQIEPLVRKIEPVVQNSGPLVHKTGLVVHNFKPVVHKIEPLVLSKISTKFLQLSINKKSRPLLKADDLSKYLSICY